MSNNRKYKKNKDKQENGGLKELSDKEYKDLYRKFRTQQYTLVHKGYAVYQYSLEDFIDSYNDERKKRTKLTKEQKRKLRPVLETVVNDTKIYTWKMAKVAAAEQGLSTKEWMKETIDTLYKGKFRMPYEFNEKEAIRVRQSVFDYYLAQSDDYDIAHAEYMTTV